MDTKPPVLYPMRTEPVYRHYLWGGAKLAALLGKPMGPEGTLAESWEVADEARVANGPLRGHTLREVDEITGGALTGDAPRYANARLPLLIKLSDAAQDLSVQIHPTDEQALRDEPERGFPGKAEMYLILDAEPGAGMYWGLRAGVTAGALEHACRTGIGVPELITFLPLTAGDVLYSPAGVVHAIGKGVVYCEVQQNSDITYRLYDWGRVDAQGTPRPLHLERALAVLDPHPRHSARVRPLALFTGDGNIRQLLVVCPYFAVELLTLTGPIELDRAVPTMRAVVVLDGQVVLSSTMAGETATCGKGQSAVLPAALVGMRATPDGHARVLLAYRPDLALDIIGPLQIAGYGAADIAQLGDINAQ